MFLTESAISGHPKRDLPPPLRIKVAQNTRLLKPLPVKSGSETRHSEATYRVKQTAARTYSCFSYRLPLHPFSHRPQFLPYLSVPPTIRFPTSLAYVPHTYPHPHLVAPVARLPLPALVNDSHLLPFTLSHTGFTRNPLTFISFRMGRKPSFAYLSARTTLT